MEKKKNEATKILEPEPKSNAGEVPVQAMKEMLNSILIAHKAKAEAPFVARKVVWVDPLWLDHHSPADTILYEAEMERRQAVLDAQNKATSDAPNIK